MEERRDCYGGSFFTFCWATIGTMLKQGGFEATEEGVDYVANYIADKAFKDPNAKFSWSELASNMASGGLSGAVFAGTGVAANRVNTDTNVPTRGAVQSSLAEQITTLQKQLTDMQFQKRVDELAAVYEKNVGPIEEASNLDEPVAVGYDEIGKTTSVVGVTDATQDLKPQSLMDELANSGVKYNPVDVIMVTHTTDGKLLWLEQGNSRSGMIHIMEGHTGEFVSQGVEDIPRLLNSMLKTDPVKTGNNDKGLYSEYVLNGNTYRIAYGTNGYIVSFFPID